MEVICLEEPAYYRLLEETLKFAREKFGGQQDKWVTDEEAMHLLNIKSRTTLQKLRDEGQIRFSQPQKRVIVYDRESIDSYLEKHARNTF
jgi:hypothetical protein